MSMDQFIVDVNEWVEAGAISTAHSNTTRQERDLPDSYVLFAYPRAFTPVCNAELTELQNRADEYGLPVVVASTDSPEAQQEFYNSSEYFKKPFIGLSITIGENNLTEMGMANLINEYGYAHRVAVIIQDKEVVLILREIGDQQRPQNYLIQRSKLIAEQND